MLFRVLQRRTGVTQQGQVAMRSGITPGKLNALLTRRYGLTLKTLEQIAAAHQLTVDALIAEVRAEAPEAPAPAPATRNGAAVVPTIQIRSNQEMAHEVNDHFA